jgi:hypothetical protein
MENTSSPPISPKKRSSVRHTRAIQRDRSKRPIVTAPDEVVAQHLKDLVHPYTLSQVAHFHDLGLRERTLTLPVMVALVVSMIWRQIGSVSTLLYLLNQEGFLWTAPIQVSEQALSQRLRVFPSVLFRDVFLTLLPTLLARAQARHRPLSRELAWAHEHFVAVLAADGSTLDALIRKVGLLQDLPTTPLAGRMTALLDVCAHLPRQIWYEEDAAAHDQRHWPQILAAVPAGALLIVDLGYTNFALFAQLTLAQITFVTRAKTNLVYHVACVLHHTTHALDQIVWIGLGDTRQQVRLIEVLVGTTWHRYLTNALDPIGLPPAYAVAVYGQRWRIEDAFHAVKRLLGLAYFWVGSVNGVKLQVWATWLLYAVLVDLTDAIAEVLDRPFDALSLEMVYRSLYFFTGAYQRGEATDPIVYLASKADRFGILKHKRKGNSVWGSRLRNLALTFAAEP